MSHTPSICVKWHWKLREWKHSPLVFQFKNFPWKVKSIKFNFQKSMRGKFRKHIPVSGINQSNYNQCTSPTFMHWWFSQNETLPSLSKQEVLFNKKGTRRGRVSIPWKWARFFKKYTNNLVSGILLQKAQFSKAWFGIAVRGNQKINKFFCFRTTLHTICGERVWEGRNWCQNEIGDGKCGKFHIILFLFAMRVTWY